MLDPHFAIDVVWGGSAAMFSLIAGFILGVVAASIGAHLGWDGDIVFRIVYLVSSVYLFAYMWKATMGPRGQVNG